MVIAILMDHVVSILHLCDRLNRKKTKYFYQKGLLVSNKKQANINQPYINNMNIKFHRLSVQESECKTTSIRHKWSK